MATYNLAMKLFKDRESDICIITKKICGNAGDCRKCNVPLLFPTFSKIFIEGLTEVEE